MNLKLFKLELLLISYNQNAANATKIIVVTSLFCLILLPLISSGMPIAENGAVYIPMRARYVLLDVANITIPLNITQNNNYNIN